MVLNNEDTKRLLAASLGFQQATEAIQRLDHEMLHWPAFYTNAYYCVELSFKAFLSSRGVSRTNLRKISHDLVRAKKDAINLGFEIIDARLTELIDQMNGNLFGLRYLEGGSLVLLAIEEVVEVLDGHVQNVARLIPSKELK